MKIPAHLRTLFTVMLDNPVPVVQRTFGLTNSAPLKALPAGGEHEQVYKDKCSTMLANAVYVVAQLLEEVKKKSRVTTATFEVAWQHRRSCHEFSEISIKAGAFLLASEA